LLNGPSLRGVEEFKLELEILGEKRNRLQPIIDRLMQLEGAPRSNILSTSATKLAVKDAPETWRWTGPANVYGMKNEPYGSLKILHYRAVILTWQSVPC